MSAQAAEITVMGSLAFKEAYLELAPAFEKASGHKVTTLWVPGVQMTTRLKGGEVVDLAIMSKQAIDELIAAGKMRERADLATSGIGIAVRAGAAKPDISSAETIKRALLAAKSIGYSTGPSGVYLIDLFKRMGVTDEPKGKLKQVTGEPVGALVARGEVEIGFQQVSELLPVPGIDLVGPLPADIQKITTFSVGLHVDAKSPDAAKALMKFLTSEDAAPVIRKKGMDPA